MGHQNKKVLICDDSLLVRMQLINYLRETSDNLIILEAGNGEEALKVYKQEQPDLVFMDMVMPVLNGVECLKAIKEIDQDAKVVMLTSTGTKEVLKDSLDAGAVEFLQKPWRKELVEKIVKNNLTLGC